MRRFATARARMPVLDHGVRMAQLYWDRQGSSWAAAVTYFAFLSVFPVLAMAFSAVGWVAGVFPQAQVTLAKALTQALPGIIGTGSGHLSLVTLQQSAGAAAGIGMLSLMYSGLTWISAMRTALVTIFGTPARDQPGYILGVAGDVLALLLIGFMVVLPVAITEALIGFSEWIVTWLGLDPRLGWLPTGFAVVIDLAASAALIYVLFVMLGQSRLPRSALLSGAVLGAAAAEVIKQLSRFLLMSTTDQPAFQTFGIALILLVWIYYFTQVVLYAAAWAATAPAARR